MNDTFSAIQNPIGAISIACGSVLVLLVAAFLFLQHMFRKVLTKIESSVTSEELDKKLAPLTSKIEASVSQDQLKIALFEQKQRFDDQITNTRHSIKNELNAVLLKIQGTLEHLQEGFAEMRGEMKGSKSKE